MKFATSYSTAVLGLLFPPHCSVCERPIDEGFLCGPCAAEIEPAPSGHCRQCGRVMDHPTRYCLACRAQDVIDGGGFFGLYQEGAPLAMLIQSLKYRGDRALVKLLGQWLLDGADHLPLPQAITFVPLTPARKRRRGFNQAALLARWLGEALNIPVLPLLKKIRKTLPQADLPREKRLNNLDGAFRASPGGDAYPSGDAYSVWLVDDVRTTGATLTACARALKQAGVRRVDAVTVAVAIDAP